MKRAKARVRTRSGDTSKCNESTLPQAFCMKQNVVLVVPLDVVQAIADFRPSRTFKRWIPRKPSLFHQWGVYVAGDDDNDAVWAPV